MSEQPVGADPITSSTPDPAADPTSATTPPPAADPSTATPPASTPTDITTAAADSSEPTPEQLQAEIDAITAKLAAMQAAQQAATTTTPPAAAPAVDLRAATAPAGAAQPTTVDPTVTPTTPAAAPVDYGIVPDSVQVGSIVRYQPPAAPGADTAPPAYGIVLDETEVDDTTGGAAQDGQDHHTELTVAPLTPAGYRVTGSQLLDDQAD